MQHDHAENERWGRPKKTVSETALRPTQPEPSRADSQTKPIAAAA
jgi:hypothetical protein